MSDQRQSEVLGALPRTRPHRRSAKRPERTGETTAKPGASTRSKPGAAGRPTGPAAGQRRNAAPTPASRSKAKPRPPAGPRTGPRAAAGSRPATAGREADRLRQPPQPRGIPSQPRSPVPSRAQRPEILATVVQAAAELTEIGLSLGTQILRRAVARLPRP